MANEQYKVRISDRDFRILYQIAYDESSNLIKDKSENPEHEIIKTQGNIGGRKI